LSNNQDCLISDAANGETKIAILSVTFCTASATLSASIDSNSLSLVNVIGDEEFNLLAAGMSATCVTRIWSLTASSNNLASHSANLWATSFSNERLD